MTKPKVLHQVRVDMAAGEEASHRAIVDLCNQALGWGVSYEDVEFTKISGGISNILVKAAPRLPPAEPAAAAAAPRAGCLAALAARRAARARARLERRLTPVVVKVFGDKTELLVDRDVEERAVVSLGSKGFGPEVLTLFGNGRIEQFLHCYTLTPPQMCDDAFVPRIAALLARFHASARVPGLPRTPTLFATIRRWLAMARTLEFLDPKDPKAVAYAKLDFAAIEAEVEAVESACAAARSPTVFAHCDLLSGNLLVLQRPGFDPVKPDLGGPLTVIDFEYGCYAPRGFDFGNHFNEYAGFECDYSRYPSRDKQALFFSYYFAKRSGGPPARLGAARLDALCAEADVFALASHIYWGVWAVVQARYSPIDFDYMGYHHLRFGEYRRRKAEFLVAAARAFGPAATGAGGAGAAAAAAGAPAAPAPEPRAGAVSPAVAAAARAR